MLIVIKTKKRIKKYRCAICLEKFELPDYCFRGKDIAERYRICSNCSDLEWVKPKLNEMVVYYKNDSNLKPAWHYRLRAFLKDSGFAYVVVQTWKLAHYRQVSVKNKKNQDRFECQLNSLNVKIINK